jgi:hypothetical protein
MKRDTEEKQLHFLEMKEIAKQSAQKRSMNFLQPF